MADRKRKRVGPVVAIDRSGTSSNEPIEVQNRNIVITRQGRRLAQASAPISAPDQGSAATNEPSPWTAEFYDEPQAEEHPDPPLPEIDPTTNVSLPFPINPLFAKVVIITSRRR
jgi:hypothetical protein